MVKEALTSRQRVLLAIHHEEADRVPVIFRQLIAFNKHWGNPFERAEWLVARGADEALGYRLDWTYHPDVQVWHRRESLPGERRPILTAGFGTPAGSLRIAVRKADDYPFEEAQLTGDHNISDRFVQRLIEGPADLDRFRYLLHVPQGDELAGFRASARTVRDFSGGRFLVEGHAGLAPSEIAMALLGLEEVVLGVVDRDPFVLELLEMLDEWYTRRLEILLEEKPDVVVLRPLYETVDFWSPAWVRRVFLPPLRRWARMAHQAGAKARCYTVTGVMPILDVYEDAGIDVLTGCDPAPHGDADLRVMKQRIGRRICLMGGLNPTVTVERGSEQQVRDAVIHAIDRCAAGGGFILSAAGSIWETTQQAYDNVLTVIRTCNEYGRYGK